MSDKPIPEKWARYVKALTKSYPTNTTAIAVAKEVHDMFGAAAEAALSEARQERDELSTAWDKMAENLKTKHAFQVELQQQVTQQAETISNLRLVIADYEDIPSVTQLKQQVTQQEATISTLTVQLNSALQLLDRFAESVWLQQEVKQIENIRAAAAQYPQGAKVSEPEYSLDAVIRRHLEFVLRECEGNMAKAAKSLGISRSTLYRHMSVQNLELEKANVRPGTVEQPRL